jgi:predicted nucleic acid-binding protein
VIAYIDSSILTRAYLPDEEGHDEARRLLARTGIARVTGTITRIEVSGALVRAAQAGRHPSSDEACAMLDGDLAEDGAIVEVGAPQHEIERVALGLSRAHGIRALDSWHLAVASLTLPRLADKGEPLGFASRDGDQATVAGSLGFASV